MKSIKAFVRLSRLDQVVRVLERAGAPGITVSRVQGVGYGYDPKVTLAESEMSKATEVAKVEIVCKEDDLDRLLATLLVAARTGYAGDGIVFVTPVELAIHIRTGEEGPAVQSA